MSRDITPPKMLEVRMQLGIISLGVDVDPNLIGMAALDATGRNKYVDQQVVAVMPRATPGRGFSVIHFFQAKRIVPVGEVDAEYVKQWLVAVDPHTLAAFNAKHPEFADTYRNCTQWQDANGNFCCALFGRWLGGRSVNVRRVDGGWSGDWWFAGVTPSELTT
jgi:hypothetical protein